MPIVVQVGCNKNDDPSRLEQLFVTFHGAIQSGDIATIKQSLTQSGLQEMQASAGDEAAMLSMIKTFSPPEILLPNRAVVEGERASLVVKSSATGFEQGKGMVHFRREANAWKIEKVEWLFEAGGEVSIKGEEGSQLTSASAYNPDPSFSFSGGEKIPRLKKVSKKYLQANPDVRLLQADRFLGGENYQPTQQLIRQNAAEDFRRLTFSPNGQMLLSSGYSDYTVRVWDVERLEERQADELRRRPTSLAVSPDGRFAVAGDVKGYLNFYDIKGSTQLGTRAVLKTGAGRQLQVAVSGNARLLATVSWDKAISFWDLQEQKHLFTKKTEARLRSVAFSPVAPILAVGLAERKFWLFDLRNGKGRAYSIPKLAQGAEVSHLSFSRDGSYLLMGHNDSSITMWRVEDQRNVHNYYVRDAATTAVAFHPLGEVYATAHNDHNVYLWATGSAQKLATLRGHSKSVEGIAFSPDGRHLVSGGADQLLLVWR